MSIATQLGARAQTALLRGLHLLPPETAHRYALQALARGFLPAARPLAPARVKTTLCGFELPHPLGLAAGFDKNAAAVAGLFGLGFSWVENLT